MTIERARGAKAGDEQVACRPDRGVGPRSLAPERQRAGLAGMVRLAGMVGLAILVGLVGCLTATAWAEQFELDESVAGRPAPFFILPKLGEAGEAASDTLYDANAATLVAFWTTHCHECTRRLQRCNDLAEWGGPHGLGFVSVNWDGEMTSRVRHMAESTAPRLLHLHDGGGRVTASFGASAHSFSLYLVDPGGILQVAYHDPTPADIAALRTGVLAEWLGTGGKASGGPSAGSPAGGSDGPPAGSPAGDPDGETATTPSAGRATGARFLIDEWTKKLAPKIHLSGRGRMRWMQVDTTGTGAVGANGEPLEPGASLRHRVELELAYQISPSLVAGGLVRISNEGEAVLRSGPDYFSHESGSFFFRHTAGGRLPGLGLVRSTLTGGFYRVSLTPLTLMRWDQDDTPISGGQRAQGCGVCGGDAGMAGFIRSESLEELGPDLTFEGARWALTLWDRADFLALYARPQTPHTRDPAKCDQFDEEDTYYLQQLYGGRLGTQFSLPWTVSPLEISAVALLVDEDEDQPRCDGTFMQATPMRDRVLSGQLRVPMPGDVTFEGEYARSHWWPDKDEDCGDDCYADGEALRIEATHEVRAPEDGRVLGVATKGLRGKVDLAYQRIEGGFYSPYNALSYESNLEGVRGAARVDWGPVGVGFFYKRMEAIREIGGPAYAPEQDGTKVTASVWADAEVWPGGVLMLGAVQEDRNLYEAGMISEHLGPASSDVLILSFTQELAADCSLMAEGTWLEGDWLDGRLGTGVASEAILREYTSSVVRVLVDVEF